ncbi:hypothetical protein P261_00456 [Lachnospiraceae bacterium TWA4]|nr:hypothetical protein P261_00456 [Lachnospiraceae bacterium TWA4]
MPYCPKCKTKYVENITECIDCHIPLVDDSRANSPVFLVSVESEFARKIQEFLGYLGIDVTLKFDSSADLFDVFVSKRQQTAANGFLKVLMANEAIDINNKQKPEEHHLSDYAYTSAKERYEDFHSSAVSLLFVGILIVATLIFGFFIYPLPFLGKNNLLGTIVMSIIAFLCLVESSSSFSKAKQLKNGIQNEEHKTESIIHWFTSTYTANLIDALVKANLKDEFLQEELPLQRIELIKIFIKREYSTIEDNYLDSITETIYENLYEKE